MEWQGWFAVDRWAVRFLDWREPLRCGHAVGCLEIADAAEDRRRPGPWTRRPGWRGPDRADLRQGAGLQHYRNCAIARLCKWKSRSGRRRHPVLAGLLVVLLLFAGNHAAAKIRVAGLRGSGVDCGASGDEAKMADRRCR